MKRIFGLSVIFSVLAFTLLYPAYADVAQWMALKGQEFEQTSNNIQPVTPISYYFDSWVNTTSSTDFGSVVLNGAPSGPLNHVQTSTGYWFFEQFGMPSKAVLDAAFPNQPYTFSTSGGALGTFNEVVSFGPDLYPTQAPYLTGNTFNNLQGMDSSQDITLTWNLPSLAGPQVNEVIIVIFEDIPPFNVVFHQTGLPSASTSITIPSGTLDPNTPYAGEVIFLAGTPDSRDSFLTGFGRATFAYATEFLFSTGSSSTPAQTIGSVTIAGTCGIGTLTPLNYGTLTPGQPSTEQTLTVSNTGTVPGQLFVQGLDWESAPFVSQIAVGNTYFGTTSTPGVGPTMPAPPTAGFETSLDYAYQPITPASGFAVGPNNTFWQLVANLINPSFVGTLTQEYNFTASC